MRLPGLALGLLVWSVMPAYGVDSAAVDQAVQRGVAALKALQDREGKWMYTLSHENGTTALAGLTLLECGVPASDPAIQSAAKYLREGSYAERSTYDLALMVLFMDRLNHGNDTPLIESMLVRLLGGQQANGAWSYECPPLAMEEITRLRAEVSGNRGLSGVRDLGKLPPKGKRSESDLTSEIRGQLELIRRGGTLARNGDTLITVNGDNSNTQFATIALWVGRRYGIPTQAALVRSDARFRATQNADGGWSYSGAAQAISPIYRTPSMATMTCAGLMALACGHGSAYELKTAKDGKSNRPDLERDAQMKLGVAALATAIGRPLGWDGVGQPPAGIAPASGKAFYFLWSLERVAMVLNLERIGDRDWYSWGSEILLASQSPEGTWVGDYKSGGVDTCFALLFLKKSNLARDLSGNLSSLGSGKVLRAAREKGASTNRDAPPLAPSGIGKKEAGSSSSPESGPGKLNPPAKGEKTAESIPAPKETMVPKPAKSPEDPARVMAQSLLRARGQERSDLVRSMRDSKGVSFTEALLWVIPMLDESGRREVRVALAERFTRLKDATLRDYLRDEESEIRRAAALAAAARESRALIPDLIERINDSEELVRRAAQTSLKELTGKDFGPGPGSTMTEISKAYQAWLSWWKKQTRD